MTWDKVSIFRTNRAITRGACAYCREDFREDVARRNINRMVFEITSASEVNTGFLSSVSILNLRQGLLQHFLKEAMKVEKKGKKHIFAEIQLYTPFRPFFDALL